jgi:hypothetical protein
MCVTLTMTHMQGCPDSTQGDDSDGTATGADDRPVGTTRRWLLRATGSFAAVGVGLGAGSGTVAADAVTVPSSSYPTVQAAVDAAESDSSITEVVVTEGTYDGTLTVDVEDLTVRTSEPKAATIEGSDSDTGPAVSIEADGVTFEGFVVRNPDKLLGIKVQAGYDGVTVEGNHVTDIGPFTRLGTTGIISGGGNSELTIAGNTVENVSSEFPDDESGYPTTNGIFLNDDQQSDYENVEISDNVVRDLSAETAPFGILLQGDLTDVDVTDNEVTGLSASNDRTPEEQEGTKFVTYAQGFNDSASSTSNVTVSGNVFDDITAEYFNGESVKIDGEASGLTLEFNDLLATVGIGNATSVEVAATCNYWGHPKGPREVSGNLVADDDPNPQGRSAYFGPADVEPWSVRSVENGENIENSCVGREKGKGNGKGN